MLKHGTKGPLFKAWMHRDCEVSNPIKIKQCFNTLSDIISTCCSLRPVFVMCTVTSGTCLLCAQLLQVPVFYVHSYFRYLFVICTVTSSTCLLCAQLLQVPVRYVHSYFRYLFVMCTVISRTCFNLMKK